MNSNQSLNHAVLLNLAPLELPSYRKERFWADTLNVSLDQFSETDRSSVQELYALLQDLLVLVQNHLDELDTCLQEVQRFTRQRHWLDTMQRVRAIRPPAADAANPLLDKVIHDIKGGAVQSLSIYLQLTERGLVDAPDVFRIFVLVRDHLKIMRSAVVDLDPHGYERDRMMRLHHIDLLIQKWSQTTYLLHDRSIEIEFACSFTGDVTERCLEFAALDRVVYNLVNNATRNTDDGHVFFSILPLPDEPTHNLRFVIYNHIPPEHAAQLHERYADHLGKLFQGGFTTGGTGLGMRICADIVGNAYGLNVEQCIGGGYVGAALVEQFFVNWFHWPTTG